MVHVDVYICVALRDCFTFISMLKASGKRKFTPPSFGKESKRDNAVKMLLKNYSPATLSPTGAEAPNERCITGIFSYLMTEGGGGGLNMQILSVCQYYFAYSKKVYKRA